MASQPTPLRTPKDICPLKGLIHHRFPLIGPSKPLFLGGHVSG